MFGISMNTLIIIAFVLGVGLATIDHYAKMKRIDKLNKINKQIEKHTKDIKEAYEKNIKKMDN